MIATGYTIAGLLIILIFTIIGFCVFGRSSGGYDEQEEEDATGLQSEVKKYSKVGVATDA